MVNDLTLVGRSAGFWKDQLRMNGICCSVGFWSDSFLVNQYQKWHYSFAIGFFGFHYIRAANENEIGLRHDSMQILEKLISACDLDRGLLKNLSITKERRFLDFWEEVLRIISFQLGDTLGLEPQRMVKLGFWLAAVYAGLIAESADSNKQNKAACLIILKNCLSEWTIPRQCSGIPEQLAKSLDKLKLILNRHKTHALSHDIQQALNLVLTNFLYMK